MCRMTCRAHPAAWRPRPACRQPAGQRLRGSGSVLAARRRQRRGWRPCRRGRCQRRQPAASAAAGHQPLYQRACRWAVQRGCVAHAPGRRARRRRPECGAGGRGPAVRRQPTQVRGLDGPDLKLAARAAWPPPWALAQRACPGRRLTRPPPQPAHLPARRPVHACTRAAPRPRCSLEHSLENQLPFLQHVLAKGGTPLTICPVIVGWLAGAAAVDRLARAVGAVLGTRHEAHPPLLIATTDFTHAVGGWTDAWLR